MIYMVDTTDYVEDNTIWGVNVEGTQINNTPLHDLHGRYDRLCGG